MQTQPWCGRILRLVCLNYERLVKVFVTGSTGFVGCTLIQALSESKQYEVTCGLRQASSSLTQSIVLDLESEFEIEAQLKGVDVFVHCAARVHQMDDDAQTPLDAYRRMNTTASLRLAEQAAAAGVKRFIFLSSIKVNGEQTLPGKPFMSQSEVCPDDPYGISKYEAEQALLALGHNSGMEIVIIRPPLVYGPGVKANFAKMMQIVEKGVPLPLGAIHNSRSLVYIGNLVDLMMVCLHHPEAANQVFMVSDDEDVSTTQLLKKIAAAMGKKSRLLPVPAAWLMGLTKLLGKPAVGQRLCSSLQVDIRYTKERLGWTPPYTLTTALKQTVKK